MDNRNEREQSEFNMAISYLNRLNFLFYNADNASMNLDAHSWFMSLLALFRELSTEMKDKEIEEQENIIEEINKMMTSYNYKKKVRGIPGIENNLYKKLHKLEIYLRKITKQAGLQTKTKDDPRFAR